MLHAATTATPTAERAPLAAHPAGLHGRHGGRTAAQVTAYRSTTRHGGSLLRAHWCTAMALRALACEGARSTAQIAAPWASRAHAHPAPQGRGPHGTGRVCLLPPGSGAAGSGPGGSPCGPVASWAAPPRYGRAAMRTWPATWRPASRELRGPPRRAQHFPRTAAPGRHGSVPPAWRALAPSNCLGSRQGSLASPCTACCGARGNAPSGQGCRPCRTARLGDPCPRPKDGLRSRQPGLPVGRAVHGPLPRCLSPRPAVHGAGSRRA